MNNYKQSVTPRLPRLAVKIARLILQWHSDQTLFSLYKACLYQKQIWLRKILPACSWVTYTWTKQYLWFCTGFKTAWFRCLFGVPWDHCLDTLFSNVGNFYKITIRKLKNRRDISLQTPVMHLKITARFTVNSPWTVNRGKWLFFNWILGHYDDEPKYRTPPTAVLCVRSKP